MRFPLEIWHVSLNRARIIQKLVALKYTTVATVLTNLKPKGIGGITHCSMDQLPTSLSTRLGLSSRRWGAGWWVMPDAQTI